MKWSEVDIGLKHDVMALTSQIWGQLGRCNSMGATICPWDSIPMAQILRIYLLWMYEAIWVGYQPETWRYGIISTPQVNLTSPIWGQLGLCNSIRVQPYALETAYQWLKHFEYMSNIDVWSGLRWIQPQTWCCSIISTPQVNLNPQIWGQLGRCKGTRVQPYALETAHQWL